MENDKIRENIQTLKDIHKDLEEHYWTDDWDLPDEAYKIVENITGLENHDWTDINLAHFIDGMQRVLHLQEVDE